MSIMVKDLPLSGPVKVFDKVSEKTIFSGTEDTVPTGIGMQEPLLIYSVDDVTYIDVNYQKVYWDEEAHWYYYESFFRSQYDEHTEEERAAQTFEQFMEETLKYEPIWEVT